MADRACHPPDKLPCLLGLVPGGGTARHAITSDDGAPHRALPAATRLIDARRPIVARAGTLAAAGHFAAMIRAGILCLLLGSGAAFGAGARAGVPATPSIRIVELAIDGTLSPSERRAMVAAQARDRAKDAAKDAREDAALKATLARHARMDAAGRARLAHQLRAGLHFSKGNDPAVYRILASRDPVLVEDGKGRDVVTRADMRALHKSNAYIARLAGVAPPSMVEQPGERAELKRLYPTSLSLRTALTQARQRHALMVTAIERLPAANRAQIVQALRAEVKTPRQVADAARGAENTFVVSAQRRAQRQASAGGELALLRKRLRQHHQMMVHTAQMQGVLDAVDATD